MFIKYMPKLLLACLIGGILGFGFTKWEANRTTSSPIHAHANWSSSAATVAEVTAEADVIVHVRVSTVHPPRTLEHVLQPDSRGTGGEPIVDVMPFTDTDMQVLKVYKGSVQPVLTVVQTGGAVPATDRHAAIDLKIEGNPLFVVGSEHILFLKNISGDRVHGKDREVYRIVNPAGRYEVQGNNVVSMHALIAQTTHPAPEQRPAILPTTAPLPQPTEAPSTFDVTFPDTTLSEDAMPPADQGEALQLPTTLKELETQIIAALDKP
jgi:hypothetical protein